MFAVASALSQGATPVFAASFVVNSTADAADAVPGDGVCATAANQCTLRAAIQESSALGGTNTVTIPAGTYSLTLGPLAVTTGTLTLNGAGSATTIVSMATAGRVLDLALGTTVTIAGFTVRGGSLISGGGEGAGIRNVGTLTLTNSVITANTNTGDGGGLANESAGVATMSNTTVAGNTAGLDGGGIINRGTLTISGSTLSGNAGDTGGGLFATGTTSITNSTVAGNSATTNGGGLYSLFGAMSLLNVTLSGNSGPGATLFVQAPVTAKNVIFSGGTTSCSAAATSQGHNLDTGNSCGLAAPGDLVNTNPLLGTLGNYGGPTQTLPLLVGSPAIDAGDNVGCPASDQRGVTRPQGPACDIGAFEAAPRPAVISINPASGPTAGGTTVVITGSNFTGATAVSFGTAVATSFVVNSATQVTAVSPPGPAGQVHVTITTSAGPSAATVADVFTYVAPAPSPTPTPSPSPASGLPNASALPPGTGSPRGPEPRFALLLLMTLMVLGLTGWRMRRGK
ncbi:MAG: hypothetical protein NVS9B1_18930 [Candidatus Dormibacteraceae bacterium]